VKFWTTSKRQRRAGKCAAAGLMFVLWLGSFLLASSPELHRLLHSDAQSPNHHCLVTQIKEHSVVSGCAALSAPVFTPTTFAPVRCAEFQFVPSCDYRLSPSRAPPSAFSSDTVAG
jgi:hypothetical protein